MKIPSVVVILTLAAALVLPVSASAQKPGGEVRIAVLGDSLTAGYGLPAGKAFPAQLEAALRRSGYPVTVINAGVSGDTTAGGLARLEWTLVDRPDLVIVELGGNDALRGLDPRQSWANLDAILTRLKEFGVGVLLAGMRAPRNLGKEYYTKFDRLYPELADRHGVALYPFFLEGVAGKAELNQSDGIHPNAEGVATIVRNILPVVREMLEGMVRPAGAGRLSPASSPLVGVDVKLAMEAAAQGKKGHAVHVEVVAATGAAGEADHHGH